MEQRRLRVDERVEARVLGAALEDALRPPQQQRDRRGPERPTQNRGQQPQRREGNFEERVERMAQPEARAHEDQRGDVVAGLRRREPRAERRARRHAHQNDAVAEGPPDAQRLERVPEQAPGRRLP